MYSLLETISQKLTRLNNKLDYYLNVASTCVVPTYTSASNYSGVSISGSSIKMMGNGLHFYCRLSLTSTAQNNIGTGNITNTDLVTFTITNFVNDGTPSNDDNINLTKIKTIRGEGSMTTGYSTGNAQPAAAHYVCAKSGTTVTITVRLDALYSKTSDMRFSAIIPVIRVKSAND